VSDGSVPGTAEATPCPIWCCRPAEPIFIGAGEDAGSTAPDPQHLSILVLTLEPPS